MALASSATACGPDSKSSLADASSETGACLGADLDPDVPAYGANSAFQRQEKLADPNFDDLEILDEFEVEGRPGMTLRLGRFPGLSDDRTNGQKSWVIHEEVVERLRTEAGEGTELFVQVWMDPAVAAEPFGEAVLFVVGRRPDGATVLIGDCAVTRVRYLVEPMIEEFGEELALDNDMVEFFNRISDPDDLAHERYLEMTNAPLFDRRDRRP